MLHYAARLNSGVRAMTGDSVTRIDFGKVDRYLEDRGFGFVSRTFTGSAYGAEVFFHIKTVKRASPELAEALNSYEKPLFWYEYEQTAKGDQVVSLVDSRVISTRFPDDYRNIINAAERMLVDESRPLNSSGQFSPLSETTTRAILEIVPKDILTKFEEKISELEQRKSCEREERRRIEAIKRQEAEEKASVQKRIEEDEFVQLVAEISALRFTHSKQVSEYIVKRRLGDKYKNISGVLEMQMHGKRYGFDGGFPPKIYARLCSELDLDNQGSDAKPIGFRSYKEINGE
ncbi:cold-shock protein [Luteimonas saliphila]|uniref:cold-shock protein n=1 Tax=Luteimonas saliphila TaxID=2804919 RepID=UPI00192D9B1C|nr:hypothetical protein [Luteimonas saliphila]